MTNKNLFNLTDNWLSMKGFCIWNVQFSWSWRYFQHNKSLLFFVTWQGGTIIKNGPPLQIIERTATRIIHELLAEAITYILFVIIFYSTTNVCYSTTNSSRVCSLINKISITGRGSVHCSLYTWTKKQTKIAHKGPKKSKGA